MILHLIKRVSTELSVIHFTRKVDFINGRIYKVSTALNDMFVNVMSAILENGVKLTSMNVILTHVLFSMIARI
jgi:hypothetical protein